MSTTPTKFNEACQSIREILDAKDKKIAELERKHDDLVDRAFDAEEAAAELFAIVAMVDAEANKNDEAGGCNYCGRTYRGSCSPDCLWAKVDEAEREYRDWGKPK